MTSTRAGANRISTGQGVATSFVTQAVGRLGAAVLGFATVAVAARYFGPENYGKIVGALAFATLFSAFGDFGLNVAVVRRASAIDESFYKDFSSSFRLGILYGTGLGLTAAVLGAVVYGLDSNSTGWLVIGLAPFIVWQTLGSTLSPAFQVSNNFTPMALAETLGALGTLVSVGVVAWTHGGVFGYVIAANVGALVRFIAIFARAHPRRFLKRSVEATQLRVLARLALPIGLTTMVGVVYYRIDTLFLTFVSTPEQLGFYGIAYRIVSIIALAGPLLISSAMFPLSEAAKAGAVRMRKALVVPVTSLLWVTIPSVAFVLVFRVDVVSLVGGREFAAAATCLAILAGGIAIKALNSLLGAVLTVFHRQRFVLVVSLVSLGINVAVLVVLTPRMGATGAAWALVSAEACSLLVMLYTCRAFVISLAVLRRLAWVTTVTTLSSVLVGLLKTPVVIEAAIFVLAVALIGCAPILFSKVAAPKVSR